MANKKQDKKNGVMELFSVGYRHESHKSVNRPERGNFHILDVKQK
ncbi:hypothetical protein OGM23_17135 [Dickeya fangzhongdai]|nr:hypothetical protein OGM23_17135 [Dickeya fangzhongdai]